MGCNAMWTCRYIPMFFQNVSTYLQVHTALQFKDQYQHTAVSILSVMIIHFTWPTIFTEMFLSANKFNLLWLCN
jgi:hypothetical protein